MQTLGRGFCRKHDEALTVLHDAVTALNPHHCENLWGFFLKHAVQDGHDSTCAIVTEVCASAVTG